MMRATVSRVIKFWLQPIFHKSVFGKDSGKGSAFSKGVAGALATVPEILAISPFENAKLAKQLDTKGRFPGGTLQVFQHLVKTRGVLGLYTGYFGMQLRQAAWTGGFFMSVDTFKSYVSPYLGQGSMTNTVAGFMAGVFGTCLNCWCDVCRTGIQKARIAETFDPKIEKPKHNLQFFLEGPSDFFSQAQKILHERGFKGLYAGFLVKSVYLGGSGALLATLIPLFKKSLNVE
ncbi:Mitochondrial carrier domain [Pseudocohnilembus persalinus]|uniref:Mitochondrial carrier domain n=1 Tax=Pseudocohnilembus persalinus TaxID=266149 RepID=A0A0V0R1B5_PSEPJ|nr:Mitochondrial carrier domain [Pseudocohnilembus persalinus]|eukprot:KRX07957.1 Mitochondrial carrier domain [Pseudocohnilembus persalinus]